MKRDVIVMGGGAAGLMCAIVAGRRGRSVTLIERAERLGKKILISGGGRCNFTNVNAGPENFLSTNPDFCKSALARFKPADFIALVEHHGIPYHEKKLGQLFCDLSSRQIVELLQAECDAAGVEIRLNCQVDVVRQTPSLPAAGGEGGGEEELRSQELFLSSSETARFEPLNQGQNFPGIKGGQGLEFPSPSAPNLRDKFMGREKSGTVRGPDAGFQLDTNQGPFECDSLVIATGGLSFPKIGATDFGHRLARQFGLKITATRPGLVPLTFSAEEQAAFVALSGLSVDTVVSRGGRSFRENILFTHRGLSGPAILQVSSYGEERDAMHINLLPEKSASEIFVEHRETTRELKTVLSQHLPARFVQEWCARFAPSRPMNRYTPAELEAIARRLHDWEIFPAGTEGYAKAEVTLGGVDTGELSSKTMECRRVPGLYFIGEVVDVAGWLGGYNFQWAWASGNAAGQFV